jgi:hypothetical protein
MNTIDKEQIDKTLEDIASIKKIINRNKPILQQVFNFTNYRLIFMLIGIGVLILSMLFYYLTSRYGSHEAIPDKIKYFISFAFIVYFIFIEILEYRFYVKSLKNIDKSLTFRSLFKELFSDRIKHIIFASLFLTILLIVFFTIKGIPYFIIPTFAILCGLASLAGAMLYIKYLLVIGYWYLITGVVFLIFNTIPIEIAIAISFGIGNILFGVLGYIDHNSNKAE